MSRGNLVAPNLDDRSWRDIVDQAKALIPRYAPEWTDHNPSDLGITLIELFAWIAESMTYRLNRVPEKNYIAFLNLLGITRDPATPASTHVTYRLVPGSGAVELPAGHQVGTPQSETHDAVVFETDDSVTLLPINLSRALHLHDGEQGARSEDVTGQLVAAPLSGKPLTIPARSATTIALGFDAASAERLTLLLQVLQPALADRLRVTWHHSVADTPPQAWPEIEGVEESTDGLQQSGAVSCVVPPAWAGQKTADWEGVAADRPPPPGEPALFWLAMKIHNISHEPAEPGGPEREAETVKLGLQHILFNSVSATNALTIVQPETLGTGNGEPFQAFALQNRPLFKAPGSQDPYAHLVIQTREALENDQFGDWISWTYSEDLPRGAGNRYRLDPVTGTVYFGNHHPTLSPDGHGSIPAANSEVRALTYRHVIGGAKGNVPAGSVQVIRIPNEALAAVTNPAAAVDGTDEEDSEDTKRRAPEVLRNRYRAITTDDYEYLAREASTEVSKVRCLAPRLFSRYDGLPPGAAVGDAWTYGGLDRGIGSLNVIVLPQATAESQRERPLPSEDLLREVSDYLQSRCPVTTRLRVTGPRYLPINIVADIRVWQRAFDNGLVRREDYREQVTGEILGKVRRFLNPLHGGPDGEGWEVGQEVTISSLFEVIQPDQEIGFIADLKLVAEEPPYQPSDRPFGVGEALVRVPLADYEIVCGGGNHRINVERLR